MKSNLVVRTTNTEVQAPTFGTSKSAGLDFYLPKAVTIGANETRLVDFEVSVQFPEDMSGFLFIRSSAAKRGLLLRNGVGLIDNDYTGIKDTIKALLWNTTDQPVTLAKGDRVVQLVLFPTVYPPGVDIQYVEDDDMDTNRGGFGSTGV